MVKKFVAVAGNIGSGKTTFGRLLSEELGFVFYEEPVRGNPFLKHFYESIDALSKVPNNHSLIESVNGASYSLQRFFLLSRVLDHQRIMVMSDSVVQDRSVYEDRLFAMNAFNSGFLSKDDYSTYSDLFNLLTKDLKHPDLFVYLEASTDLLKGRIKNRIIEDSSRLNEFSLTLLDNNYIADLNSLYHDLFSSYNLGAKLRVDVSSIDFDSDSGSLSVVDDIRRLLK